jgi:alpha-beta hydrolase superfamily lysophospholipase
MSICSLTISSLIDPRLKLGIPIIGCPDFLSLMAARAKQHSLPMTPPYHMPDRLLSYIRQHDPVSISYDVQNASNPFLGKKILVLAGGMDTLVPYSAGKDFVEKLQVGTDGVKQVVIIPDAGHECTPAMVAEMERFIEKEALSI